MKIGFVLLLAFSCFSSSVSAKDSDAALFSAFAEEVLQSAPAAKRDHLRNQVRAIYRTVGGRNLDLAREFSFAVVNTAGRFRGRDALADQFNVCFDRYESSAQDLIAMVFSRMQRQLSIQTFTEPSEFAEEAVLQYALEREFITSYSQYDEAQRIHSTNRFCLLSGGSCPLLGSVFGEVCGSQ